MGFGASSVFHLFRPYLTFFALVNNLLWHLVPHLCSTLFPLIQPFSPLSPIYYGIWCLICVPPFPPLFDLVNNLSWHLVPHLCSTLFHLIRPYSPLSTIYYGIWCLICVPPFPPLFDLF